MCINLCRGYFVKQPELKHYTSHYTYKYKPIATCLIEHGVFINVENDKFGRQVEKFEMIGSKVIADKDTAITCLNNIPFERVNFKKGAAVHCF